MSTHHQDLPRVNAALACATLEAIGGFWNRQMWGRHQRTQPRHFANGAVEAVEADIASVWSTSEHVAGVVNAGRHSRVCANAGHRIVTEGLANKAK